jgi:hypothetical protein
MEGGGSPIQVSEERLYYLKTQSLLGNVYSNINLAKGLELRTTVGVNIINQETDYYGGRTLNYISRNQGGDAYLTADRHNSWQIENYLTYNKKILIQSILKLKASIIFSTTFSSKIIFHTTIFPQSEILQ